MGRKFNQIEFSQFPQISEEILMDAYLKALSKNEPQSIAKTLIFMIENLVEKGEIEKARELAGKTPTPFGQRIAWCIIATKTKEERDREEVHRISAKSIFSDLQAEFLAFLVEVLAEKGNLEEAEKIADSINIPYWQAKALITIAKATQNLKILDEVKSIAEKRLSGYERRAIYVAIANLRQKIPIS
jgi:uncharacterized protein (DUF885 family)